MATWEMLNHYSYIPMEAKRLGLPELMCTAWTQHRKHTSKLMGLRAAVL